MNSAKKKSFFVAVVCLILSVALLVGTTFAWFTDSVSNTGNKIQAGTLDIDLQQRQSNGDYISIAGSTNPVFDYDKWEPGYSNGGVFRIVNNGTLALKYNLSIGASAPIETFDVNGVTKSLADVIDVYYREYTTTPSAQDLPTSFDDAKTKLVKVGTLADILTSESAFAHGVLLPEGGDISKLPEKYRAEARVKETYVALVLHMQEEAGNEYQGKKIGASFDISLNAAQVEYEKDGFDSNLYDESTVLPEPSIATFAAVTEPVTSDQTVITSGNVETATVAKDAVNGVFNDMKSQNPEDSNSLVLTLNVNKTNESSTENPQTGDTAVTVDFDISMEAAMTITNSTGSNTDKQEVKEFNDLITIQYNLGKGFTNVVATHNSLAMEELTSATATPTNVNGGYFYDSTDGVLTIRTKTLSPFQVTYSEPGAEVKITKTGVAEQKMSLAEFRDLVNGGNSYEGYTVTLLRDVNLNNTEWQPIGLKDSNKPFKGTFDGDGKKVSGLSITGDFTVGDVNEDYEALFGLVSAPGEVKNLTVEGSVSGSNAAGIVARLDGGKVTSCTNKVSVTGVKKAGGITVLAQQEALFDSCVNSGAVTLSATGPNKCVGGVFAMANSPVTIKDTENTGTVSCNGGSAQFVGGILGYYQSDTGNKTVSFIRCKNRAVVSATSEKSNDIGGIVGKVGTGSHNWTGYIWFEDCVNEGDIQSSVSGEGADIMGTIADCAATTGYSGPLKPARIFVKGTLTVRTNKKICGNYNLVYNGSDELVENPVSVPYVNTLPQTSGEYDIYTGLAA